MPLYEYICGSCGKKTEVIQSYREKPLKICPHCGGRMKKAISAPAIQFKGSGWYVTDYGSKKEAAGRKKSESAGGSESGPSETKEKEKPARGEAKEKAETKTDTKKKAES